MVIRNKLFGVSIVFLVVVLLIAAFWYSNNYGEQAKKNEMKETINILYQNDVKIEEIEYIDKGLRNVGDMWMVEYKVMSSNTCIKYRSWFSPKDISLDNTEKINSCN